MKIWQSLLFAIVSVACLFGISVSIANRSIYGVILAFLLFLTVTAIGFIYKARLRRRNEHQIK
jgi:NADH:ubiquinone oxidoreductase subunit 3 (subunit A)